MASAAKKQKLEGGASATQVSVIATAPVNIAVIKYWGKRDESLILPINSSLSGTIHQGSMCSTTKITAGAEFKEDAMRLNNKVSKLNKRMQKLLAVVRDRAQDVLDDSGVILIPKDTLKSFHIEIDSHNNFPTAAGLASSASGLACFAACLAKLYRFQEAYPGELTTLARMGSGSACRSLHSGFVKWEMGEAKDGKDSIGVQVAPDTHWPEMRVLILVASSGEKKVSSTSGMEDTVATSPLIKYRAEVCVPDRMKRIQKAILAKDFETFGKITMEDSNQFHACCLDTYPPIFYLNETSKRVIELVHLYNNHAGKIVAAYTFDAGPNAVIYTLSPTLQPLLDFLLYFFAPTPYTEPALKGLVQDKLGLVKLSAANVKDKAQDSFVQTCGSRDDSLKVYNMIVSRLGPGAQIVESHIGPAKL
eukprot:gb/GEZN01007762.1/.p1 GENE.gb/GEZN01007762.1/~~gb/GEZN01007762.1/.p1  ORF type:complete len:420 (-),score=64.70 gb/GEZN01007762.1/:211-1470(-)